MATAFKSKQSNKEQPGQFRILTGSHIGEGPEGCECVHCRKSNGTSHVYEAYDPRRHGDRETYDNDVIDSAQDLERRGNYVEVAGTFRPCPVRKFERINDGDDQPEIKAFPLERMSVQQPHGLAEDENIDLGGAVKKADIIAAIRQARQPQPA